MGGGSRPIIDDDDAARDGLDEEAVGLRRKGLCIGMLYGGGCRYEGMFKMGSLSRHYADSSCWIGFVRAGSLSRKYHVRPDIDISQGQKDPQSPIRSHSIVFAFQMYAIAAI